jgi:hypothetical protein
LRNYDKPDELFYYAQIRVIMHTSCIKQITHVDDSYCSSVLSLAIYTICVNNAALFGMRILGNVANARVVHHPNKLKATSPYRPGPIVFVEFEGGMQ